MFEYPTPSIWSLSSPSYFHLQVEITRKHGGRAEAVYRSIRRRGHAGTNKKVTPPTVSSLPLQVFSWKQQSAMLRNVCKQIWEESGSSFSTFWLESEDAVRMALAKTVGPHSFHNYSGLHPCGMIKAYEDLPKFCHGALLELTCPELVDTQALVRIDTEEGIGKSSKLLALTEMVSLQDCSYHSHLISKSSGMYRERN